MESSMLRINEDFSKLETLDSIYSSKQIRFYGSSDSRNMGI
jgi:hypothetical protein